MESINERLAEIDARLALGQKIPFEEYRQLQAEAERLQCTLPPDSHPGWERLEADLKPDPFAGERFRLVNRESGSGDQTPPRNELPAYRITCDNEDSYVTSMAVGITLDDARNYFLGQRQEVTETTFRTVVSVDPV